MEYASFAKNHLEKAEENKNIVVKKFSGDMPIFYDQINWQGYADLMNFNESVNKDYWEFMDYYRKEKEEELRKEREEELKLDTEWGF